MPTKEEVILNFVQWPTEFVPTWCSRVCSYSYQSYSSNIVVYRLFLAIAACPQCPPLQRSWISFADRDRRENSKQAHLLLSSRSALRLGTRHINWRNVHSNGTNGSRFIHQTLSLSLRRRGWLTRLGTHCLCKLCYPKNLGSSGINGPQIFACYCDRVLGHRYLLWLKIFAGPFLPLDPES